MLLLMANLDDFASMLYHPSELKSLTESRVESTDKDCKVIRDSSGSTITQCRFRMFIGSNKSLDNYLRQKISADQAHEVYHDDFKSQDAGGIKSALSTFYKSIFADSEATAIDKTLNETNVHHLVIFGRRLTSKRTDPDQCVIQDSIISAATFIIDPKHNILLWIAVSVESFGESWGAEILDTRFNKNFKLGSFSFL